MNFDILQLNDMIVPELIAIAEKLAIPDAKGIEKQTLIYKILDAQAVLPSSPKPKKAADKEKTAKPKKAATKKAAPKKAATKKGAKK